MKKSYITPAMEAQVVKTSAILNASVNFKPNESVEGDGDAKMSIWEGEE